MSVSSLCSHLRATVLCVSPGFDTVPGSGSLALSFPRNVTVAGATRRLLRNLLCTI